MRLLALSLLGGLLFLPACATSGGYAYGNNVYQTRSECLAAKHRAQTRGAIGGGAVGAVAGVALGGNLGEVALATGAGALAGAAIGSNVKHC